jgi:hypothetical protein
MKASYNDIKSRIKEVPRWYDEYGVPRYEKFLPRLVSDIYAQEVVLLKIACQECHQEFLVAISWDAYRLIPFLVGLRNESFSTLIRRWVKGDKKGCVPLHYGDPPRHGNCAGNTMNCYDLEIVEFWRRRWEWRRNKRYEKIELEKIEED